MCVVGGENLNKENMSLKGGTQRGKIEKDKEGKLCCLYIGNVYIIR